METIVYKYGASIGGPITLSLPDGAQPLCFAFQGPELQLWALVDPHVTQTREYAFHMAGTGCTME